MILDCRGEVHVSRVVEFFVAGEPVPWSAPDIGMSTNKHGKRHRFAKKNPALTNWQKAVAKAAKAAYGPRDPSELLVHMELIFKLKTGDALLNDTIVVPEFSHNPSGNATKKGSLPDKTNLVKAVEDALEDIVYVNDTQVRSSRDVCLWNTEPGVCVRVYLIDSFGFSLHT